MACNELTEEIELFVLDGSTCDELTEQIELFV